MFNVHFLENSTVVLTQLLRSIPSVDENIRIKGRKGKVVNVKQLEKDIFHVYVLFEPVVKNQLPAKDTKKKKR